MRIFKSISGHSLGFYRGQWERRCLGGPLGRLCTVDDGFRTHGSSGLAGQELCDPLTHVSVTPGRGLPSSQAPGLFACQRPLGHSPGGSEGQLLLGAASRVHLMSGLKSPCQPLTWGSQPRARPPPTPWGCWRPAPKPGPPASLRWCCPKAARGQRAPRRGRHGHPQAWPVPAGPGQLCEGPCHR